MADLSQRELAERTGVPKSAIAGAEAGGRGLDVRRLAACAALAGLRVGLLTGDGREIGPMAPDRVRDNGGRRFPAHLDTRRSDGALLHEPRRDRPETSFTVIRDRRDRDAVRRRWGTPGDHHPVLPGDTPWERREARRRESVRKAHEEVQRRFLAGELRGVYRDFLCSCPPACAELEDWSGPPVHAPACRCRCDVG